MNPPITPIKFKKSRYSFPNKAMAKLSGGRVIIANLVLALADKKAEANMAIKITPICHKTKYSLPRASSVPPNTKKEY